MLQDIEDALVKRDIKRQKLAEAKNVPGLVARVNEMNSTALRRRTKMMLPAPQVRALSGADQFVLVVCASLYPYKVCPWCQQVCSVVIFMQLGRVCVVCVHTPTPAHPHTRGI
jgi:hypothetical protein